MPYSLAGWMRRNVVAYVTAGFVCGSVVSADGGQDAMLRADSV